MRGRERSPAIHTDWDSGMQSIYRSCGPLLERQSVTQPQLEAVLEEKPINFVLSRPDHQPITDITASDTISGTGTTAIDHVGFLDNARRGTKQGPGLGLKCEHEGCSYKGTFHGRYELNRHDRLKHWQVESFACPFPGCFRGLSRSKFARGDKLTAHIRAAHHQQLDNKTQCPIGGCLKVLLEFDLLGIHIRRAHKLTEDHETHNDFERAIINAASSAYLRCPVQRCYEMMKIASVADHMLRHSQHDLEIVAGDALLPGHRFLRGTSSNAMQAALTGSWPLAPSPPIVTVQVTCPICSIACDDHASFALHLCETHLIKGGEKEHFRLWRDGVASNIRQHSKVLQPWTSWVVKNIRAEIICTACGSLGSSGRHGSKLNHHISMQVDPEDIRPYRREILKLYPDFASHPVFDDLA